MIAKADSEYFHSGADKYAAYLETPEGRLRSGLAFANLQDFLVAPQGGQPLLGLDLGCGTGETAVRLARLGIHMTLLDSSTAMLEIAKRAAQEAGVDGTTVLSQGDAAEVAKLFPARAFDVILCHNVLEYVDDPVAVLRAAGRAMRDSFAILSVIVRNQAGEVLKAAIRAGDLAAAEQNLTAQWGHESLYGGRARLFTEESLQAVFIEASLAVIAKRGVRVVSDYLSPRVSLNAEYDRIFELELKLGRRAEFAAIARYAQWMAHCPGPVTEGCE